MTILLEIDKTVRAMGPGNDWQRYDHKTLRFDSVGDALAELKTLYPKTKGRKAIYVDTKSRGTIQTGWIYSGRDDCDKQYTQDWVSLAEVTSETTRECRSLDVKAIRKAVFNA